MIPALLPSLLHVLFPSLLPASLLTQNVPAKKGALKTRTPEIADWRLIVQNMLYLALLLFKKYLSQHFKNWEILH